VSVNGASGPEAKRRRTETFSGTVLGLNTSISESPPPGVSWANGIAQSSSG
jgi:hypothetical protein